MFEVVLLREYLLEVMLLKLMLLEVMNLFEYVNLELGNLVLDLDNVRMGVMIKVEMMIELEMNLILEVFVMIFVVILINDLYLLEMDVELDEDELRGEWNIRENMLYWEEVEGWFRSVLLYIVEKKSYVKVEVFDSEVVYYLDEEVRRLFN